MNREQAIKQIKKALDVLEKSEEIVHLPDATIEICDGDWQGYDVSGQEEGQDIGEGHLAGLMRYLVDMMA